jgi:hypothetical protein
VRREEVCERAGDRERDLERESRRDRERERGHERDRERERERDIERDLERERERERERDPIADLDLDLDRDWESDREATLDLDRDGDLDGELYGRLWTPLLSLFPGPLLRVLDLGLDGRIERLRRLLLGEAGDCLRVCPVLASCSGPDSGGLCPALPSLRLRRLDGWSDGRSSSSGSGIVV